ncbi:MAG: hypothetical protein WC214_05505, partial [Candidatus Omnitrophota bacterium]
AKGHNWVINMWWLKDTKAPFGVLPGSIVFKYNGSRLDTIEFMLFNRTVTGEELNKLGGFYALYSGIRAYEYKVYGGKLKKNVTYSATSQKISEKFSFPVALPMTGILGKITMSDETIYFDPDKFVEQPLRAVLELDEDTAMQLLNPGFFNKKLEDKYWITQPHWDSRFEIGETNLGIKLESIDSEEVRVEDNNGENVKASVVRIISKGMDLNGEDAYITRYSLESGRQKTEVDVLESEGLNLSTKYSQRSVYSQYELETKYRYNLWEEWGKGLLSTSAKYAGIIIGSFLFLALFFGKIAAWWGQLLSSIKKQQFVVVSVSEEILQYSEGRIEEILSEIKGYDSYGFQSGVVSQAKEGLLIPQIRRKLYGGANLEDIIREFFYDYRINWVLPVLGTDVKATDLTLEDMYLYYLVTFSGVYFVNTGPNTKFYYFYRALRMRDKENISKKNIGPYVEEQFGNWSKIIKNNIVISGAIFFEDIEDYFRSKKFIDYFESGAEHEMCEYMSGNTEAGGLSHLFKKTYHDISGGILGWKGWLVVFSNYFKVLVLLWLVSLAPAFIALPLSATLAISLLSFFVFSILKIAANRVIAGATRKNVETEWEPISPEIGHLNANEKLESKYTRIWDKRFMRKIKSGLFMVWILGIKAIWNWLIWESIKIPLASILYAKWGFTFFTIAGIPFGLNILALLFLFSPFLFFFFLDIFAYFYFTEAFIGYVKGKFLGTFRIKTWHGGLYTRLLRFVGLNSVINRITSGVFEGMGSDNVRDAFGFAANGFKEKILPPTKVIKGRARVSLTAHERNIAWAKAWNMIIAQFNEDDLMSLEELKRYSYVVEENEKNFLDGKITSVPDLSISPENQRVRIRIFHFLSTLLMDMDQMPEWQNMPLFSVISPCFNEIVMYLFSDKGNEAYEAINEVYETGETLLTYIIKRHKSEWRNFVNRITRMNKYSYKDIRALRELNYGEKLIIVDEDLQQEVRLWISYRYQPLSRTIRGIMNYRQMYDFLARVNYPTFDSVSAEDKKTYEGNISKKIDDKFEYLLGHQPYGAWLTSNKENEQQVVADVNYMMKKYKFIKLPYLGNYSKEEVEQHPDRTNFGSLLEYREYSRGEAESRGESVQFEYEDGGVLVEVRRIDFPVHYFFGQGKPVNQNNILRFVRGEVVQFMDMNQDMYLEETFKAPNAHVEFDRDPSLTILGYPEDIITDTTTPASKAHAFADRTFNSIVQRTLDWAGIRFHYGHPDFMRADDIRRIGLIIPAYVNEDIFGAYKANFWGKKVINREILWAGKAREGTYQGLIGINNKFAAGATEQAISRVILRIGGYKTFGKTYGFVRHFMHFVAAPGYYLRKFPVALVVTNYTFIILLLGISGFVAFPEEAVFGIIAVFMSQAITSTGYLQLVLEKGFVRGTRDFFGMFPLLALAFGSLVFNAFMPGAILAVKGLADYVGTGRICGRWHNKPFIGKGNFDNVNKNPFNGELYQWMNTGGLQLVVLNIIMAVAGFALWQNWGFVWSAFFMLMYFSSVLAPAIFNPGSLPVTVGVKKWASLYSEDIKEAFNKLHFYRIYLPLLIVVGLIILANTNPLASILVFIGLYSLGAAKLFPEESNNKAVNRIFPMKWYETGWVHTKKHGFFMIFHFREQINLLLTTLLIFAFLGITGLILALLVNIPFNFGNFIKGVFSKKVRNLSIWSLFISGIGAMTYITIIYSNIHWAFVVIGLLFVISSIFDFLSDNATYNPGIFVFGLLLVLNMGLMLAIGLLIPYALFATIAFGSFLYGLLRKDQTGNGDLHISDIRGDNDKDTRFDSSLLGANLNRKIGDNKNLHDNSKSSSALINKKSELNINFRLSYEIDTEISDRRLSELYGSLIVRGPPSEEEKSSSGVREYVDSLAEYDRAYLEALRAKSLQEAQTLKIG